MTIPLTRRVSVPPHVLVRQIQGESVLLNLSSECYFGLDEVGTRMWTALTTAASMQAAYEELLSEYEVDSTQLRENLEELLQKLLQHGLVEVINE